MAGHEEGEGKRFRSPLAFAGLGFEVALPVVLFMWAGHKVDGWLGSDPWLLVLGALVGIGVGLYTLFRQVLPSTNDESGRKG